MKLQNAIELYSTLNNRLAKFNGRIAYAANKNMRLLKSEVEIFEATRSMSPEMTEYDNLRIALCKSFAQKDEQGNVKTTNENGAVKVVLADAIAFEGALAELQKRFADALNEHREKIAKSNALLTEEITLDLYRITVTDSEIQNLDGESVAALMDFIELK